MYSRCSNVTCRTHTGVHVMQIFQSITCVPYFDKLLGSSIKKFDIEKIIY